MNNLSQENRKLIFLSQHIFLVTFNRIKYDKFREMIFIFRHKHREVACLRFMEMI